jgi:ABC-type Na+ efflux pump permease subunit
MDMAAINSTVLADDTKILNKNGKAVDTSYIGKVSEDLKKVTGSTKAASSLIDDAAIAFEKSRVEPEVLAKQAGSKHPYFNQIKEAPNAWWARVYYELGNKKEK